MRAWYYAIPPVLVMLFLGCTTVDADQCWPNTSGGLGGTETIPIGAGVGAVSSGDFVVPPPYDPLDNGGEPYNPCITHDEPAAPSPPPPPSAAPMSCELPSADSDGATVWLCADACFAKCPAPGGGTFVSFKPSDFPFVTIVQDDGNDPGGGWQLANVNLGFTKIVIPTSVVTWFCPFSVGMPLRTEKMGKVSASRAADLSVEITEGVARGMDYSLPQGIFCDTFLLRTRAAFKAAYPFLGAKVTK